MRITAVTDTLEKSDGLNSKSFSIHFNEKLARMLSKGIYQNVIRAPIRELACNGLDSHRAAGKAHVPIQVHLPNVLEPYFEVRDEGLGLNDEGIYSLFTTYGGSNKDHSNDDIGGFGLGSKSPFAYTNTFNVTSVHDGVKRHYVMHKDALGKPHVTPMGSEPTAEPNGVTVRVPVKTSDFRAFCENAQETFRWFDVPPVVSGNKEYKLSVPTYMEGFDKPMWSLIEADYRYDSRATVLMANVAYPLRAESLTVATHKRLVNYPIVLRFNNGELEPSVSREELNYDEATVQVLEVRLAQVLRELTEGVQNRLKAATTLWEARLMMREMYNHQVTSNILDMLNRSGQKLQWQGNDVEMGRYYSMSWHDVFNQRYLVDGKPVIQNPAPRIMLVSETSRAQAKDRVEIDRRTRFILKDCSDASTRCNQAFYRSNGGREIVYLIEGIAAPDKAWMAPECPQVTKWLDLMGNPPITLASSLPQAPKKVMKFKGREWTGGGRSRYGRTIKSYNWKDEQDLKSDQGGYYVTVEGLTPWKEDVGEFNLHDLRDLAIKLGIIKNTDQIWGINKTNTKLISDSKVWKELHGHVTVEFRKLLTQHNLGTLVHEQEQLSNINHRMYSNAATWHRYLGTMQNVVGVFVREWVKLENAKHKTFDVKAAHLLATMLRMNVEDATSTTPRVDLDGVWSQVIQTYPLLRHVQRMHLDNEPMTDWVAYVNLIDTTNK